jgi:hypothetical protein
MPGSVAGLPISEVYCAMLQVSAAGSVVGGGGAGVASGGGAGGVVLAVSAGAVEAGSVEGVHAISATPARIRSDAVFMARESRPRPICDKHAAA